MGDAAGVLLQSPPTSPAAPCTLQVAGSVGCSLSSPSALPPGEVTFAPAEVREYYKYYVAARSCPLASKQDSLWCSSSSRIHCRTEQKLESSYNQCLLSDLAFLSCPRRLWREHSSIKPSTATPLSGCAARELGLWHFEKPMEANEKEHLLFVACHLSMCTNLARFMCLIHRHKHTH